jgi:hypothetical protein
MLKSRRLTGHMAIMCPVTGHMAIMCPVTGHMAIMCPVTGHMAIMCPVTGECGPKCKRPHRNSCFFQSRFLVRTGRHCVITRYHR